MSTCNGSPTPQAPEKKSLGLAGSIARIFINSPLAPLSLVVLLAAGILGLVSTCLLYTSPSPRD